MGNVMALIQHRDGMGRVTGGTDDTFNYEDMDPQMLGYMRDYIARNLSVSVSNYGYGNRIDLRVHVVLENVVISQDALEFTVGE
ncbi:hypothetical protein [Achromobacter phage Motura]|uniref:Uncharacterized protein n=1 Tax=Achromobacter phage Motura TaxID=2591403 RepID=A0A514CSW3_9CAUD|nr:hypothetical protein H1O15_gp226 [Achromobacter phage Motura]QDH83562.1 hypothetical protein [Achromobacter phage Motura]